MTSGEPRNLAILFDPFALRRAAYLSLLDPWADEHNIEILTGDEGPTSAEAFNRPIALEIFVLGAARVDDPDVQLQLLQRRQLRPGVPLALVSDHEDRAEVTAAFRHGARGFVPSSLDPELARQAFGFILAGGTFFPPHILDKSAGDGHETSSRRGVAQSLTPRQLDVLALLREGKSNKLIARDLEMCESTVKVHVRQIMRKLGAANRTQAALNGIGATGPQVARATSATLQNVEDHDDRRRDPRHAQHGLQHVAAR